MFQQLTKAAVGFRRLAAFVIDWCILALYAGVLFLAVTPLVAPLFQASPLMAELTGFGLLTLPMVLYFAIMEASSWRATIGKRVLHLSVGEGKSGRRIGFSSSLFRSAVKFLPWELAHFAVWNVFIFTNSPVSSIGVGALVASYLLIAIYIVSLFIKNGRTPYDMAAGTAVRVK